MRLTNRILAAVLVLFIISNISVNVEGNRPFLQFGKMAHAAGTQYYYNKYNAVIQHHYTEPGFTGGSYDASGTTGIFDGWASYTFNSSSGFTTGGSGSILYFSAASTIYYIVSPTSIKKFVRGGANGSTGGRTIYTYYSYTEDLVDAPTYSQGTLVQSNIQALEGTYPDNGYNSADGYWYVKGNPTNFTPVVNITKPSENETFIKVTNQGGRIEYL